MSSETARCVNCGETHAVEMVGGLRVIGCPAMLADGSQIFLDEAASRVARNEPMREKEARMDKSETWKCTSCGSSQLDNDPDTAEALRYLDATAYAKQGRAAAVKALLNDAEALILARTENAKLREERDQLARRDAATNEGFAIASSRFAAANNARAFVAAVAALPCVHGRKRADGPCVAPMDRVGMVFDCPPCAARRLMASEERDG